MRSDAQLPRPRQTISSIWFDHATKHGCLNHKYTLRGIISLAYGFLKAFSISKSSVHVMITLFPPFSLSFPFLLWGEVSFWENSPVTGVCVSIYTVTLSYTQQS